MESSDPSELALGGKFAKIDAMLAAAVAKVLNGELAGKINVMKEESLNSKQMLSGRRTLWHAFHHYQSSEEEGSIFEFKDILSCSLKKSPQLA